MEARPDALKGVIADWASDQRVFKNVSWGKAMMWIFLLSDTFIFSCFLLSYTTVRMSTTVPWPNPSEVFALRIGGQQSQSLDSGRRCLEHRYPCADKRWRAGTIMLN
jgi:cytochrome c oxidase subunit 3